MTFFSWMAWTWPTAAFVIFLFASIAFMGFLEWRNPGGHPRRGVLGLDTTRGDRLFLSYLGGAFILLGWLGFAGEPIWGAAPLIALWVTFVFWKV